MDAVQVKKKIVEIIGRRGPSLPIQISKEMQMSSLFVSAFLSELAGEQQIKISHLKVGGSPLYYILGQENLLENFNKFLNSKEIEAFNLIKKERLLKDSEQDPAIRVALRSIRDFSIGFKRNEEIYWRYVLTSEEEVNELLSNRRTVERPRIKEPEILKEIEPATEIKEKEPERELEKEEAEIEKEGEAKKTIIRMPKAKAQSKDKFLEDVKSYLAGKKIQFAHIEKYDKKEVNARVTIKDSEYYLIAFNKKKIDEKDLARAYKKASKLNLPFYIYSNGDPSKKLQETLDACRLLAGVEKLPEEE